MRKTGLLYVLVASFVISCATMNATEREARRSKIDAMAMDAIKALVKQTPDLQTELDKSIAYGVADMKVTKVPVVGAGAGRGVLFIKNGTQHIYFKVRRFDIGGGWGVRSYKVLILIRSRDVLNKWRTGKWIFEAGAEASAGSASAAASSSGMDKGFSLHVLAEGGASATATARIIHIKVDRDLTGLN